MTFPNNYKTLSLYGVSYVVSLWSKLCLLLQRKLSINFCFSFNNISDYGVDKYDIGTGFGHFGIAVDDVRFPNFSSFYCPS